MKTVLNHNRVGCFISSVWSSSSEGVLDLAVAGKRYDKSLEFELKLQSKLSTTAYMIINRDRGKEAKKGAFWYEVEHTVKAPK